MLHFAWFGPAENVIESEIEAVGVDQINGTLINRIGRPITNAVLFTGARVYDLGTLAPVLRSVSNFHRTGQSRVTSSP